MDWALDLGSSLQRVHGVTFLYSELANGVPTIFAHHVTNMKAMHSVLVFICIQHLPISHILDEERVVVRRLGPKPYHMYRIAVRYGYADHRVADPDFEGRLIDSLASYISDEELRESSQRLGASVSGGSEDASAGLRRRDIKGGSALLEQDTRQDSLEFNDSDYVVVFPTVSQETADQECASMDLARLEQSRYSGVVYLVGRTEVRATEGSSTFRRFIIDKAYNFLRKNCRAHSVGLNAPPSRIVQIGMLHRI